MCWEVEPGLKEKGLAFRWSQLDSYSGLRLVENELTNMNRG